MTVNSQLPTTYKYDVFRPDGTYLGVLPKVVSTFNTSQDINTAGSQIVITTNQDIDTQQLPVTNLTDESGSQLTDEAGNPLTTSRAPDIYGDIVNTSMIQNGNIIKVWEYTKWQPNGVNLFTGVIEQWNPHVGTSDNVDITCLNYGSEFDNNIVFGTQSPDQASTNYPSDYAQAEAFYVSSGFNGYTAQTFTTGPTTTSFSGLLIQAAAATQFNGAHYTSATLTVSLYTYSTGIPTSGTFLGSQSFSIPALASINGSGSLDLNLLPTQDLLFSSPIAVNSNAQYALVFTMPTAGFIGMAYADTGYQGGSAWTASSGAWTQNSSDQSLFFVTFTQNTNNQYPSSIYFNADPASGIVTNFMGNYISPGGGRVGIGNVTPSSAAITITFIQNTLTEGINECLGAAPAGYYWYVDLGSNLLYFQPKSTTPDHIFTFKVHINNIEPIVTTETIKNAVYLTAGNTSNGNSIVVYAEDAASVNQFGRRLDRISDTRILDAASAQLVANNYVAVNGVELSQSTINIYASVYDLSTLKLGDVVGFNNFQSYIDNLQLQIVSIVRSSDYATLTLGTIAPRSSSKVERLERSLLSTQTMNNPLNSF